ncbi:MAG TPA: hypothetical protein VFR38_08525 [Gaiellaceae bacterium]|nr:hypothetical protein [Gaiellaceae bacterium]
MQRSRELGFASVVLAALTVAGGAAALTPDRTIVTSLPVRDLALTGRSVAFVADAPKRLQCARIGLWNSATNRRFVFDSKEQCLEEGSTGQGVWDVAVATRRVLWLTFAGGNFREWSLWTATTTRPKPRQLRFVARDVDGAPPIALGPGTAEGMPYAVDRRVVYLADSGKAIFTTTVAAPVRAIAAGQGPNGVRVAALLSSGVVVGLDRRGQNVTTVDTFPRGSVTAVRVSRHGIALQMRNEVHFDDVAVELPSGANMLDIAQDRVLWMRAGDLGTTTITTGKSARLVDGTPRKPAHGQIEPQGVAWSVGRTVRWRGGTFQ